MNDRLPVLIVGAGPTGLLTACGLAYHGISFRIIDKNANRTLTSNATWIQPRTIELLDTLEIANPFVKLGHHCNAIHLHAKGKLSTHIPLNHIDSTFPFVVMLPQSETEKLLTEHLLKFNVHVERPLELIDVKQDLNYVTSTVHHQDGQMETIISDWLIACDGANSTVREKSQIYFTGADLPEQFMVADAQMDSFMSHNEIHMFLDKKTMFAAFPLGSNKYRIMANLDQSHPRKLFIEKEVREIVNERTHGTYNVHSISWIYPFWIHSKIVEQMRHGSIFLAGDAAHIHSPAGGQGMNSGLQDAYNLAWKLALVIKDKAKPSLLDSYQNERHPVMSHIVNQTEYLTKMALFDKNFLIRLKKFFSGTPQKKLDIINKMAMQITQLHIQYCNSPIIKYNNKKITKKLKPGMRALDVYLNKTLRLYNYLHNTQHNILFFTGMTLEKNTLSKLRKIERHLNKAYPDLIKIHIISIELLDNIANCIHDKDALIHKKYHVKYPTIYIVRPDNFIAYYSKKLDPASIDEFLQRYLYPQNTSPKKLSD